jgi:arginyl-tRNA synthetase
LTWESDVVGSGFLAHAVRVLEQSRFTSRPTEGKYAGAFVMDVSAFLPGLEEPQVVLLRSDGTAMYTAKDIGLQFWKFGLCDGMKFKPFTVDPEGKSLWTSAPDGAVDSEQRFGHAEEVINVIDSRQAHPQTIVRAALGMAGEREKQERSIHLSYAFVTYQGQTISGRKGSTISADEAMDEAERRAAEVLARLNPKLSERPDARDIARTIGIGAIRFAMLKVAPDRTLDFQWDRALSLQGDAAPYVQYAAVRAANIVRKGVEAGFAIGGPDADWAALPRVDVALAKQMARLPEVIEQCVRAHTPHVLAQYALDLATAFNGWYNAKSDDRKPITQVLQSPPGVREARLALMARLRQHFERTMGLLGIEIPAAM